jgi:hypothetical protein
MTVVWDKISKLAADIEDKFKQTGEPEHNDTDEYGWHNAI